MVEDKKLQAVTSGSGLPQKAFGSKEDEELAKKFLSAIVITEDQTRESFASVLVESLENVSTVKFLHQVFKIYSCFCDFSINNLCSLMFILL